PWAPACSLCLHSSGTTRSGADPGRCAGGEIDQSRALELRWLLLIGLHHDVAQLSVDLLDLANVVILDDVATAGVDGHGPTRTVPLVAQDRLYGRIAFEGLSRLRLDHLV